MSTATKVDFFEIMTYALFGFLVLVLVVETLTWLSGRVRESLRRRRLRRAGIEEELLPRPNAGFHLEDSASAVRRHFDHADETGLLIQQGWAQARHRNPPPDAGSRHLREPD